MKSAQVNYISSARRPTKLRKRHVASSSTGLCRAFALAMAVSWDRIGNCVNTHFCMPETLTQAQMVAIFEYTVRQLIAKYPEDMKSPAISLVGAGMNRTFPCAK